MEFVHLYYKSCITYVNEFKNVAFSVVAVAAIIALFVSGPLLASAQAFPGFGFYHFGIGFPG